MLMCADVRACGVVDVRAGVCIRACMRAFVRARVHARVRACRICMHVRVRVDVGDFAAFAFVPLLRRNFQFHE